MLTAKSEIDDKVFGLDSVANDYMTKHFDTNDIPYEDLIRSELKCRVDDITFLDFSM